MNSPAEYLNPSSIPSLLRRRRFPRINAMIERVLAEKGKCRILDLGGTEIYWKNNAEFLDKHKGKISIITVNIGDLGDVESGDPIFTHVSGDATDARPYRENEYDFIHSNSVIEHVGAWPRVRAMADNIEASGKPYYLQTPNMWFPLEPHYRSWFFQFLPEGTRARILMRRDRTDKDARTKLDIAMSHVEDVKLLDRKQMKALFPNARLEAEWLGPFVKSWMVMKP
jgi:hypothetical protein